MVTKKPPAYSAAFNTEAVRSVSLSLSLEHMTREWAWEGSAGKGVKVAIIDSGVDASHPAVGHVDGYVSLRSEEDNVVYDSAPHDDVYGHGTACAGIIRSLAPECEIYSVRVLGPSLMGKGAIFAAGLRWAIEQGMQVCNMSLGTTKKDFFGVLHELTDMAYFRNVMLVTAANNMPTPSFPSVYSSVISVASHAVNDPTCFYFNPSPPVEFGAFGIDVPVAWQDGGTITATGNSFAAPHIAGIIAKILGKHPRLTAVEVKVLLRNLATNVNGGLSPSRSE